MSITIKERVLESSFIYQSAQFPFHEDNREGTCSTFPKLPMGIAVRESGASLPCENGSSERVLQAVYLGRDGREKVSNSSCFPFSIVVQLKMKFDSSYYNGSGCMIGPQHVLTCAHNIYDNDRKLFASEISVIPGLNGDERPYGEATVTREYYYEAWTNSANQSYDIALLVLNRPLGEATGWGGVCTTLDSFLAKEPFHITGYPGDKGCKEMWTMCHKVSKVCTETFEYLIDTNPGQSGSPIWSKKWDSPIVVGVHTRGSPNKNFGVRISKDKFKRLIIRGISESYVCSIFPTIILSANQAFFGKEKWERHFGTISTLPELPKAVLSILDNPCPFWSDKKIRDTHRMIAIPHQVNGDFFDLNLLSQIVTSPKDGKKGKFRNFNQKVLEKLGKTIQENQWILITNDVIPQSRGKTFCEQKKLLDNHNIGSQLKHEIPKAIELATAILTHYCSTGQVMYGSLERSQPWTYSRCEEKIDEYPSQVALGGFNSRGLSIDCFDHQEKKSPFLGIGAVIRIL